MTSRGSKYAAKRRSRLISLRLSEDEYRFLSSSFAGSGARNLSDHLRNLLNGKSATFEATATVEPEWVKALNRKIALLTEKVDGLMNRDPLQQNHDFSARGN